jgi:hypothetical protein
MEEEKDPLKLERSRPYMPGSSLQTEYADAETVAYTEDPDVLAS